MSIMSNMTNMTIFYANHVSMQYNQHISANSLSLSSSGYTTLPLVENLMNIFVMAVHYTDVIMCAIVPQITGVRLFTNRLFRRRSKKTWKLRVTGLCEGNSPMTSEFPHKWPVTRKMFPIDYVIMNSKFCIHFTVTNPFNCPQDPFIGVSLKESTFHCWTICLTHCGWGKMAAVSQTTRSNKFSWMKMI